MPELEDSDVTLFTLQRLADRWDLSVPDALRLCVAFTAYTNSKGLITVRQNAGSAEYRIDSNPASIEGRL